MPDKEVQFDKCCCAITAAAWAGDPRLGRPGIAIGARLALVG
jgi:hypothetical protein